MCNWPFFHSECKQLSQILGLNNKNTALYHGENLQQLDWRAYSTVGNIKRKFAGSITFSNKDNRFVTQAVANVKVIKQHKIAELK